MSGLSNYPPGVTGNEPQINGDEAWEAIHELIDEDAGKDCMTDQDVMLAWKLGLAAWKESKKWGAKYPSDC